ncbi:hypothetical protein C8R41DRAFT_923100 [Lentinula lateritia]|uniref:Uncharacterized protein n=1 Tax=Lentinula lateritia TaxID=40482 RepID=A0ABQ8V6M0_9AGAR|nr:hypothetical protein C8R41DRAFT_923100 [Lentinula lateritia]
MANHSFQYLLSSPDVPPSPFPQYPSQPPLDNTGHYNLSSLRRPIQNPHFLREFTATPYSAPQSRTNLHQIPAQSSMPDPKAYSQPTSRIGFSSREAYAQPTSPMDFPSPGIEFSSGRSALLRDNNHQTRPDIVQSFQSVNGRHYTPGSFSSGYDLPPRSDFSAVTSQKGHLGSSQRGALQWKETVICSNVDASRLHLPTPPHSSYSSPPLPTPNSGRSYGPGHDHHVVSILNNDINPTKTFSIPQSSQNLFPRCEPSTMLAPSAGPCFSRPLSHEPLSTSPSSLSPRLSGHPSTLNSLSSLAHLADPRLSGRSVSCSPLPLGEESPSSIRGSSGEADSSLVGSGTNSIQSTPVSLVHSAPDGVQPSPVSTGQAEQVQYRTVNLGISEKSLAKATSALKTKLLNQAISQLQAEQEEKVVDLADTHGVVVSRLKKLAGTSKHHRKRRVNSVQDAILHAKSKELNQGRRYKAKINEIRQAAELDHDLQNAKTDPDKLKVLMDELEEHQQAKKDVARASNKAGAMKATKLLQGFNSDFQELRGTTDIAGFGFFVRGSFESSIKPTIVGGGPVLEFFQKYFNKDPWEMACLFEAFVTTYNKVGSRKLLHSEKAKVTSKTISESLAHITGIDKI